jgi:hypothetical protein
MIPHYTKHEALNFVLRNDMTSDILACAADQRRRHR